MDCIGTALVAACVLALLAVLADRQQEARRRYEAIEKKLDKVIVYLDIEEETNGSTRD